MAPPLAAADDDDDSEWAMEGDTEQHIPSHSNRTPTHQMREDIDIRAAEPTLPSRSPEPWRSNTTL